MLWTIKATKLLKKYWNIEKLKDKQFDVINEILSGKDCIGLLPTSYGKSMCYILPPLLTKKTMLIISPLISLMDDQKEKLLLLDIPVSALHSNNNNKQQDIKDIIDGTIRLIYMSPEYLINGNGLELAQTLYDKNMLGFLAIDESHCLSSWGHDFRPNYLELCKFRKAFPSIPILAVTATAKEEVVQDIINLLQLKDPRIIRANFDRPNLYLGCELVPKILVKKKEKLMPYEDIIKIYINKYPNKRIIVYVSSRKKTEDITVNINKHFNSSIANAYHAGLSKDSRECVQREFIEQKCNVIISTIAFGMGIDQIVRCVLCIGCPSTIEEYWQQIGRGGRDGLECETILYFDYGNYIRSKIMINKDKIQESVKMLKIKNMNKVHDLYCTLKCRRQYILEYLGLSKSYFAYNGFTCSNCDNCTKHKLTDITSYIWDHYMLDKPLNKKIENIIFDKNYKLSKILKDWKEYIQFKNYNLITIPENMKLKLNINEDIIDNNDILYDKYNTLIKSEYSHICN